MKYHNCFRPLFIWLRDKSRGYTDSDITSVTDKINSTKTGETFKVTRAELMAAVRKKSLIKSRSIK